MVVFLTISGFGLVLWSIVAEGAVVASVARSTPMVDAGRFRACFGLVDIMLWRLVHLALEIWGLLCVSCRGYETPHLVHKGGGIVSHDFNPRVLE